MVEYVEGVLLLRGRRTRYQLLWGGPSPWSSSLAEAMRVVFTFQSEGILNHLKYVWMTYLSGHLASVFACVSVVLLGPL